MQNPYKRQDVFRCTHDAHAHHGHRVSVYHTLRKECFPNGCTYFRWKCHELEKRRQCYRGYTHVGKNCPGCKFFDEEKVTRSLVKIDDAGFHDFQDELEDFEEWLRTAENREHECYGTLTAVKPLIRQRVVPATRNRPMQEWAQLKGFMLAFSNIFIGRTPIDDGAFAIVGRDMQARQKFRTGDRLDFKAVLTLDQGRLVLQRLRQIDFSERGGGTVWTASDAIVSRATGKTLARQAEKCVECDQGLLIDVTDATTDETMHRIFCLQGMPSAAACTYRTGGDLYGHSCANRFYSIFIPQHATHR